LNLLRRWMTKLFFLIDRRRFTNELDEEMVFHREQAQREFIAEGMMPEAARYAAMRQFGNGLLLKQRSHEVMEFSAESVAHDLRYALRQLAGNRGFTVVMLVTLALSIGANSAIFSVIQAVLFKPLPYPRADRIMRLFLSNASYPKFPLNPFDFRDFRARSKSFESLAAFTRADMQLSGSGDPVQLHAFRITSGFFRVLGLRPALGREFDFQSELPGNGLQVILSDRLWRTRFNANPDIVGRPVTFNEQQFTVVGVMPQGTEHPGNAYHSVNFGDDVDAWWPFAFEGSSSNRGSHYMDGIGRLKPGVTPEQARSEMNAIMAGIEREHSSDADWRVLVIPLYTELVGSSKRILWVLLGAVGMVLLIACANAANLLLARAAMRQREIAVRLALGASRARLVRQLLTESLVISFTGGALGLALAVVGVRGLVSILPADMPRAQEIHVSAPVFAFTLAVSILTGILFGLAPALAAARTDPKQGLQKGGRSASSSGHQSRMRGALVICEVSLQPDASG
jgi:predicted permease